MKYKVEECYTVHGVKVFRVFSSNIENSQGDFKNKKDADDRAYELNTLIE